MEPEPDSDSPKLDDVEASKWKIGMIFGLPVVVLFVAITVIFVIRRGVPGLVMTAVAVASVILSYVVNRWSFNSNRYKGRHRK